MWARSSNIRMLQVSNTLTDSMIVCLKITLCFFSVAKMIRYILVSVTDTCQNILPILRLKLFSWTHDSINYGWAGLQPFSVYQIHKNLSITCSKISVCCFKACLMREFLILVVVQKDSVLLHLKSVSVLNLWWIRFRKRALLFQLINMWILNFSLSCIDVIEYRYQKCRLVLQVWLVGV